MCATADGCFLIKAYQQNLDTHGPDTALRKAAQLYRRTNTAATEAEALAFVARFVAPSEAPACTACG